MVAFMSSDENSRLDLGPTGCIPCFAGHRGERSGMPAPAGIPGEEGMFQGLPGGNLLRLGLVQNSHPTRSNAADATFATGVCRIPGHRRPIVRQTIYRFRHARPRPGIFPSFQARPEISPATIVFALQFQILSLPLSCNNRGVPLEKGQNLHRAFFRKEGCSTFFLGCVALIS